MASTTKKVRETPEYAQLMTRLLGTYERRVGRGDLRDLEGLAQFAADVDAALAAAVASMRESQGYSWTDIGNALGITRQAAQMRFGRKATVSA